MPAAHSPSSVLQRALDARVTEGCPGAILVLDGPRPGLAFAGSSGRFARGADRALAPQDAFRAASVTKAITAAAVVRLAAEGRWGLDDPAAAYLTPRAVRALQRFEGLASLDELTFRRLLAHTSGLPDYFFHPGFQARAAAQPDRSWAPVELLEAAAEAGRMSFAPGTDFSYGDTGFVVAGLAIEGLTGRPLAEAYRALVFEPLDMASTFLEWHEPPLSPDISHHYQGDADLRDVNTSYDWAGGGLVTTAQDLVRFLRGLFGCALFGARWLEEMTRWNEALRWRPGSSAVYRRYGLGIGSNPACGEEILGATGYWGAFAYYCPALDVAMAGTLNLVGAPRAPLLDAAVCAVKPAASA